MSILNNQVTKSESWVFLACLIVVDLLFYSLSPQINTRCNSESYICMSHGNACHVLGNWRDELNNQICNCSSQVANRIGGKALSLGMPSPFFFSQLLVDCGTFEKHIICLKPSCYSKATPLNKKLCIITSCWQKLLLDAILNWWTLTLSMVLFEEPI